MSFSAINWARKHALPPSEKFVLIMMADYAHEESGVAFPSVGTLVADTGLSERTIKRARQALLAAGLIEKAPRYGQGGFRLCLEKKTPESATKSPRGVTVSPNRAKSAREERGDTVSSRGVTVSNRGDTMAPPPNHHITTNNHHTPHNPPKVSKPAPKPKQDFELPDWIPADAWNGWIEMRRSIKKNPTPRALALAVKTLGTLRQQGHAPGDVLDQSTLHGWQGLFPIKSQRVTGGNGGGPSRLSETERNRQAIFDEMNAHYGTRANEHQGEVIFQ